MSVFNLKSESKRPTRVGALVLLGSLLAIGSSVAQAASAADEIPSVTVRYSDLNLSTDEGARALYSRIATAARLVCPEPYSRDLTGFAAGKTCQTEAIARAVRDVHSPRLAETYSERTNHG